MVKIAIIGLGYVGSVTLGCLSKLGHSVIGVDIKGEKISHIKQGKAPIYEKNLDSLISEGINNGNIDVTTDINEALEDSNVIMVCVRTPADYLGDIDTTFLETVSKAIAQSKSIDDHTKKRIIIFRSTIFPGTFKKVILPIFKDNLSSFDFGIQPEFMREGNAVEDFMNPSRLILGTDSTNVITSMKDIYKNINSEWIILNIEEAEMVKYVENAFHALKITFANEIGIIAKMLNIDSYKILDVLTKDKKLNLSNAYLTPGFAFGGSCLPKDLSTLIYRAGKMGFRPNLLNSIIISNSEQVDRLVKMILNKKLNHIGFFGLTFKENTDDLRESPIIKVGIEVIQRGYTPLLEKGFHLFYYDKKLKISELQYITDGIFERTNSIQEFIEKSDLMIMHTRSEQLLNHLKKIETKRTIIDLTGYYKILEDTHNYESIV